MKHTDWFTHDRFGMFLHWGLYALAARHEYVAHNERIHADEYERYARYFDPDLYDPVAWARMAREAGIKYVVLTAKHHEGFCLWDSQLTDFTAARSPYGRDLIRPFVEAVRAEGLRVGFYYSLLDWHHPSFPIDSIHPHRDDADIEEQNKSRDIDIYREYLHGQIRELLTGYGKIDYLFYDYSYSDAPWGGKGAADWGSEELVAMTRELQPGIIINDRLGVPGDLSTPEQYQPEGPMLLDGQPVVWEACQTLNGSWGYYRDNYNDKSADQLLRMLIDGVSKNGNLLLNVGPTARGQFDPLAQETLRSIGTWMAQHSRSIYGAGASEFVAPRDARYTQRGDRLYLHLFAWPMERVHLQGLAGRVEYAKLLNDASELKYREHAEPQHVSMSAEPSQGTDVLTLELPSRRPDVAVPVVELYLRS